MAPGAGPVLGVVATGAGLATAELVVGLVDGAVSPVVAVGQKVVDLVPAALREWAIETFGTSDKTVLVTTTLGLVLLMGAGAGALAGRGHRVAAALVSALVGAVGIAAVVTGRDPAGAELAPIICGTAVAIAVLWWLVPAPAPGAPDEAAAARPRPGEGAAGRRVFLARGVGVVSASAIAGGLGRLLQGRFRVNAERDALVLPAVGESRAALPPNTDLGVPGLSPFVTPNADFYRIDTALAVPQVSREDWSLRIHGMVDRELVLTFDDLLARDQIEEYVTLSCVSNPVGGNLAGNALWQGVRLDAILAEAGVHPDATQLVSRSNDGWTCGTPVASVTDGRNAMLAIAMNGEPLPAEHGYPVRMVVPGEYGYVSATKWVVEMELTTWDAYDAYWVPRGWAQQAPMKTMTRIETPRDDAEVTAGTVTLAGTAWAVHRGVSAVEVRVDGGEWMRARLGAVPSPDTWRQWSLEWTAEPGRYRLEARATDGLGEVQTSRRAEPDPDGASGYHEIFVTVT